MTIDVFLVDDHEIVRHAIADMLELDGGFRVVGGADGVAAAVRDARRVRELGCPPDVAVVDVRLPDGDACDVIRALGEELSSVPTVVLTAFDDDAALLRCHEAGAAAFVLKSGRVGALLQAIRAAHDGRNLIDASRVADARRRIGCAPDLDELSDRERQVFDQIALGSTNREIGRRLGLAEKTVKNYTSSILRKLGVARRTELMALAARVQRHLSDPSGG